MKTPFLTSLSIVGLAIGLMGLTPAPASAQAQQTINGYLFSKLAAIGSKSEEPQYFIQKFDDTEIKVTKHAGKFQDDKTLRALLGTKVTITGTIEAKSFSYTSIIKCPTATKGCEIQW